MFGNNKNRGNSSISKYNDTSSPVRSGYDISTSMNSLNNLRDDFADALTLEDDDVSVESIQEYAALDGETRGYTELYKRQSKNQLAAARSLMNLNNAQWNHLNSSAQLEAQWAQSTGRNLERLSGTMLDLGTAQASHDGFSSYLDEADQMIGY